MGYSLPVAIGACIAAGEASVVAIAGDGGFQCNIQELEVIARLRLPIKILVINNRSLGLIRQFQEEYHDKRYPGSVLTYAAPDFARIADAYNIEARRLSDSEDIPKMLDWLLDARSPRLLDVDIATETGVYPKMLFGHRLDDMYPPIDNIEMPPPPVTGRASSAQ